MDSLDDRTVAALRQVFADASYTVDEVTALLGPDAHAALLRDATVPGLRATTAPGAAGSPLATLTRLWPLQAPVSAIDADRALEGLVERLVAAGLLARDGDQVRGAVDVRPYGDGDHDWWVVSDLTPGLDGGDRRVSADHVLGVNPASSTLAQLAVRTSAGQALDLGTGCGVQSLHLATHARQVVATDINRRALEMARLTTRLCGIDDRVDLRAGSLFDPVAGQTYELVVTNPPFVVSPATGERLVYRDSGLPGDEVVRRIVTEAPRHLAPGGWCQVLANWVHVRGEPWSERVGGWLAGSGCDAWVVQREVLDPAAYVEMWLADAGLLGRAEWARRYDDWLAWMDAAAVEAIGMGWVCLRRTDRARPTVQVEHWPWAVAQPLGPEVDAWGDRVEALARLGAGPGSDPDAALTAVRPVRVPDVVQESYGQPGAVDPARIVLRRGRGLCRARPVDTVEAALVGACDGDLSIGQVLDAIGTLVERDPVELRREYLPVVRELVEQGWLDL